MMTPTVKNSEALHFARLAGEQSGLMGKSKDAVRIDNIYFLSRIGLSLRWATRDIARRDLPPDIRRLLARLDRLDARARREPPDDRFGRLSACPRLSRQPVSRGMAH